MLYFKRGKFTFISYHKLRLARTSGYFMYRKISPYYRIWSLTVSLTSTLVRGGLVNATPQPLNLYESQPVSTVQEFCLP